MSRRLDSRKHCNMDDMVRRVGRGSIRRQLGQVEGGESGLQVHSYFQCTF